MHRAEPSALWARMPRCFTRWSRSARSCLEGLVNLLLATTPTRPASFSSGPWFAGSDLAQFNRSSSFRLPDPWLRPNGGLIHAGLVGEDHGLDPVPETELHQHALHMGPDRRLLDHQRGGDLSVREPPCD